MIKEDRRLLEFGFLGVFEKSASNLFRANPDDTKLLLRPGNDRLGRTDTMNTHLTAANDNPGGEPQITIALSDLVTLLARAAARSAHDVAPSANTDQPPKRKADA